MKGHNTLNRQKLPNWIVLALHFDVSTGSEAQPFIVLSYTL